MNSTVAASSNRSFPEKPKALENKRTSMGRIRFPPAPMMYWAIWLTMATSDASLR